MGCCVMGLLLQHAFAFPEISREFSTSLLPSLLTVLLEVQPQVHVQHLGEDLTNEKSNAKHGDSTEMGHVRSGLGKLKL